MTPHTVLGHQLGHFKHRCSSSSKAMSTIVSRPSNVIRYTDRKYTLRPKHHAPQCFIDSVRMETVTSDQLLELCIEHVYFGPIAVAERRVQSHGLSPNVSSFRKSPRWTENSSHVENNHSESASIAQLFHSHDGHLVDAVMPRDCLNRRSGASQRTPVICS